MITEIMALGRRVENGVIESSPVFRRIDGSLELTATGMPAARMSRLRCLATSRPTSNTRSPDDLPAFCDAIVDAFAQSPAGAVGR